VRRGDWKRRYRQKNERKEDVMHCRLSELANDDSKDQENQNSNDGNGDYFIRSHSSQD
jgi:hypothetical protein